MHHRTPKVEAGGLLPVGHQLAEAATRFLPLTLLRVSARQVTFPGLCED